MAETAVGTATQVACCGPMRCADLIGIQLHEAFGLDVSCEEQQQQSQDVEDVHAGSRCPMKY